MLIMESQLRTDCRTLLKQLQKTQNILNKEIASHTETDNALSMSKNITGTRCDLSKTSTYARNKLLTSVRAHDDDDNSNAKVTSFSRSDIVKNKENLSGTITDSVYIDSAKNFKDSSKLIFKKDKSVDKQSGFQKLQDSLKSHLEAGDDNGDVVSSSWQPATPNTQRRRMIIDRHTHVPSKLDDKELRDLNNERKLNFSYTHINTDDVPEKDANYNKHKQFKDRATSPKSGNKIDQSLPINHENVANEISSNKELKCRINRKKICIDDSQKKVKGNQQNFREHLEDDGNNRKLNTFIRDTTIKPKSLLNSTTYSLHNLSSSRRNNSNVRFNTSRNSQDSFPEQRLLGYDWIAALLDNNSELMDQSESFFNELRDFRKAYKDECSNQFYMEGPHTLVDFEPAEVAEVLKEPKVEPYVVNERLFAEPLKTGLIDYEHDDGDVTDPAHPRSKRKPTADNPRFVRVSIPRSTLQAAHRARPCRRRSFDASDTCSLKDHCQLGWENAIPAMIPTAKSLDLNTAAGKSRDYQKLTFSEAEEMAMAASRKLWAFDKPHPRLQLLPLWKKHYMDGARNISASAATAANNSSIGTSGGESIKRATDKLLRSAYLTMYDMERLKEERRLESLQRGEGLIK